MEHLTLTISDFEIFRAIKSKLIKKEKLSDFDKISLIRFFDQIPASKAELEKVTAFEASIAVRLWNVAEIERTLQKWRQLFSNIPGFDHSPAVNIVDQNGNPDWFYENTILVVTFSPTLAHNEFINKEPFEIRLKDDGTALFWFPTCEDTRSYPALYNFNGSWKEAYLLLIETLKKGWPMEEFPEELQQFLKK